MGKRLNMYWQSDPLGRRGARPHPHMQHYSYAINKDTDDRGGEKRQSALEQMTAKGSFSAIIACCR